MVNIQIYLKRKKLLHLKWFLNYIYQKFIINFLFNYIKI